MFETSAKKDGQILRCVRDDSQNLQAYKLRQYETGAVLGKLSLQQQGRWVSLTILALEMLIVLM